MRYNLPRNVIKTQRLCLQPPPQESVRCDKIALYTIYYSVSGSETWENIKAESDATSRTVNGGLLAFLSIFRSNSNVFCCCLILDLDFDTEYSLIVIASNNELKDGRSGVEKVRTDCCCKCTCTPQTKYSCALFTCAPLCDLLVQHRRLSTRHQHHREPLLMTSRWSS